MVMTRRYEILLIVSLIVGLMLSGMPAQAAPLSPFCTNINGFSLTGIFDWTVSAATVGAAGNFNQGEVLTVSVNTSTAPTVTVEIPAGNPVATINAPGQASYTMPSNAVANLRVFVIFPNTFNVTFTCGIPPAGGAASPKADVPPDDRLNWRHGDLLAVVYRQVDKAGKAKVVVYQVNENSRGFFVCSLSQAEMALYTEFLKQFALPENIELKVCTRLVKWYLLTNGQAQLNIGPDAEGKMYTLVFDPATLEVAGRS
jgi:hypothetical protein